MSYHGLGAGMSFNVSVDAGGGGGGGTSPSGCTTTQYGITGCDNCNKNANAYCCATYGGPTGKQSVDPTTGAFWADCKTGYRAARTAYGAEVKWFVPGVGMSPPPPPPPAPKQSTGLAQYYENLKHQAALTAWLGKMGKPAPAPAAIKVIGGSGGNRPPASSGTSKQPTASGGGWMNKGPSGTPSGTIGGSGQKSSGSGGSSAPSADLLADINRAVGKASGVMTGAATGKTPSPSTPVVGQGAIVSTYEVNPDIPPLPGPVTAQPMPGEGWSTGKMVAVGALALMVVGGAAYVISQRSAT